MTLLKKSFITLVYLLRTLGKEQQGGLYLGGTTTMGFCREEEKSAQLSIQGQGERYSQGAGWGAVDEKLLGGNVLLN